MAKPKKSEKEDWKDEDDNGESRSVQLTTKKLLDTRKAVKAEKARMETPKANIGNIMQSFQEAGGNNLAFRWATKLADMEDLKAQSMLRDFYMYLTEFGVFKQLDMLDEVPTFGKKTSAAVKTASAAEEGAAAH